MSKSRKPVKVTVKTLKNGDGEIIENAPHPMMKLSFECPVEVPCGAYLRMERKGGAIL